MFTFNFIKFDIYIDEKKFIYLLIIVIVFFNFTNLNRIFHEHKKYSKYKISVPLIHYPIQKMLIIEEYEMLCRVDYKCEYKKNIKLEKYRFFNILYEEN